MTTSIPPTASTVLHYRRQYYQETVRQSKTLAENAPHGLVGREVANAEFLSALLKHARQPSLDFLLQESGDRAAIEATLSGIALGEKRIRLGPISRAQSWFEASKGSVLWQPQPPSASWAWMRHRLSSQSKASSAPRFALCGITHALCSPVAIESLRNLVTAPTQPFDRLVCTSTAVATTAAAILDHWNSVVAGGAATREGIRLKTIPLGIDTDRHCPPTAAARIEVRQRLKIPLDADVVLFVGRLSHHAKSNPMVTMAACQAAAEQSNRRVVLLMAGWFANDAVREAFRSEAARIAPKVQTIFVDGTDQANRDTVWHAADVFVSLADSIQETFGLTVVEASSRGLPVVASDWNGYRDTVLDGKTGYLIPTAMIHGAGESGLVDLMEGRVSYDHFLARIGQGVIVDHRAAKDAIIRLLDNPPLRAELGRAGHQHAKSQFAWPKIISRFEDLWDEQRFQMIRLSQRVASEPRETTPSSVFFSREVSPSLAPDFDVMFSAYPSTWWDGQTSVVSGDQSVGDLETISESPLSGHSAFARWDADKTKQMLQKASSRASGNAIQSLIVETEAHLSLPGAVETAAWALKFDLLRADTTASVRVTEIESDADPNSAITLATTCMGRLSHLKQTLPHWIRQHGCRVVVVDFSCPDRVGDWVRENFDPSLVSVVEITGRRRFDRSEAKNAGILAATTPWVCLIDADVVLREDFSIEVRELLRPGRFLRSSSILEGTGGTFLAHRDDLIEVGMHDRVYQGWGEEDDDLLDALQFAGLKPDVYPDNLVKHIDHDDDLRTQFHDHADRRQSHMINRIYRAAKWDMAKLSGGVPSIAQRQRLYADIAKQLQTALDQHEPATITVETGQMNWVPLAAACGRQLSYRVEVDDGFSPGKYATK